MRVVTCQDCEMTYMPDDPASFAEHQRYHDPFENGVRMPRSSKEKIVWCENDLRVVVVRHADAPLSERRRAGKVVFAAIRDDPFDGTPYFFKEDRDGRDVHLFMLMKAQRAVGLLVAQLRPFAVEGYWPRSGKTKRKRGKSLKGPIWTIARVWVLKRFRRKGFGKQLVDSAATHLGIGIASFAWSVPFTGSGAALAKASSPRKYLAAD